MFLASDKVCFGAAKFPPFLQNLKVSTILIPGPLFHALCVFLPEPFPYDLTFFNSILGKNKMQCSSSASHGKLFGTGLKSKKPVKSSNF